MDKASINLLHTSQKTQENAARDISFESTRPDSDEYFEESSTEAKRGRSRSLFYLSITLIAIVEALAFLGYIHTTKIENAATWRHCGNTSEEAHANNCVLDFIAGAWVPKACWDFELENEFLNLTAWHWYADSGGEQELSIESIREDGGPDPIFVTVEYHWVHCAYTWKKMHRARMMHLPIDTHVGDYAHTVHCADGLMAQSSDYSNETRPISRFTRHFETCTYN
jgi:hypothetical protein